MGRDEVVNHRGIDNRLSSAISLAVLSFLIGFTAPALAEGQRRSKAGSGDGRLENELGPEVPSGTDDNPAPNPGPPGPDPGPEPPPFDPFPHTTMAESVGWILEEEPAPSDPVAEAEERLDRYFAEILGQDRMRHIGADGWYYELGRAARRNMQIDIRAVHRERRRAMNPVQVVIDELGRYASGPSAPQDVAGQPTPEMRNPGDQREQAMDQYMDQMNLLNAPVQWTSLELRLTQSPEGEVLAIWITRSSDNAVLDREVMRGFRRGAARTPPPPLPIHEGRNAIVSEWRIEIGDVATYLNQAGCVIDPESGVQCAAGGRGIVRIRVQLLRVVDAQNESIVDGVRRRRRLACEAARRERASQNEAGESGNESEREAANDGCEYDADDPSDEASPQPPDQPSDRLQRDEPGIRAPYRDSSGAGRGERASGGR